MASFSKKVIATLCPASADPTPISFFLPTGFFVGFSSASQRKVFLLRWSLVIMLRRQFFSLFTTTLFVGLLFSRAISVQAALPDARSAEVSGDIFLGGEYIELGMSRYGSFGTQQSKPTGFFGTAARNQIGMSSDLDGFDTGTDWRMDFFMPGTQEERWSIGYTLESTPITAANAAAVSVTGIANNTATNMSEGDLLRAVSVGTHNDYLEVTQDVSFQKSSKFFKNTVTLKNVSGGSSLDSVRFMRSFDPDNTRDKGGDFATQNTIVATHAAGDESAIVQADTSWNDNDPVYLGTGGASGGTRSPILFYSSDTRARVSFHSSLVPGTVYTAGVYNSVQAKGATEKRDGAISIAFDVGTLNPGQSQTFTYYTSLDERDFSEVIQDIQQDEQKSIPKESISFSSTGTTVDFSWVTDATSSSQIEFGLRPSLGSFSPEEDTDPRVQNHSITLSDLLPCTRYYYKVHSEDVEGNTISSELLSFTTEGCGISEIEDGVSENIGPSGGSVQYDKGGTKAKIEVPEDFPHGTTQFQINKLSPEGVNTVPPENTLVGGNIFDISAYTASDEPLLTFDSPATFVLEYNEDAESSHSEDSLGVYAFVSGAWVLQPCEQNKDTNLFTCPLNGFSTFALFGKPKSPSVSGTTEISGNSFSAPQVSGCAELPVVSTSSIFQVDHVKTRATVYFMPIKDIRNFYLSYSTKSAAEEHGVEISVGDEGVQHFLVEDLLPNTPYYFKIRPLRGCQSGDWSAVFHSTLPGGKKRVTDSQPRTELPQGEKVADETVADSDVSIVQTEPTLESAALPEKKETNNRADEQPTNPGFWAKVRSFFGQLRK